MKILYFIALIAAAFYLFINLPKEKHKREPVAYWGCWAWLAASVIYWIIFSLRHHFHLF